MSIFICDPLQADNVLIREFHNGITLTHKQLVLFNQAIKTNYHGWIESLPDQYKVDGFFLECQPISITCCFGQNQPFAVNPHYHADQPAWSKERDYRKIRYVSVAIATHIWYVMFVQL